jgi:Asp-tRNA(Asn)/Glu-tRNA(Gln) amidotransferase A subunit family amidase
VRDPADLSAAAAAAAIRRGALTSEALTAACLARIAEREPAIRAFVDLRPDAALARARELDQRRPRDDEPLYGVPVAVKEVFDVAGYRCAWGTPIHAERVPDSDAAPVARLKAAGAVILGTAVSTEYAIAAPGPTTNPHDPRRTPGGSSSGPAAAVASGMVPLALGSQSIGSVIRPATYCGVLGLKPTFGAISTLGGMALAEELDHVGILARDADDVALACRVLFGHDPDDPVSRDVLPPDTGAAAQPSHALHVVGPLNARVRPASERAVQRAVDALRSAGVTVTRIELPADFDRIEWITYTLLCRGIARHHGADYDRAAASMSPRLRELVERGRAISDADHEAARSAARETAHQLAVMLPAGTVAVNAAVDDVAPPLSEGTGAPILQALWTVAGLPALAVPCGRADGMPIGPQLAAGAGQEASLLAAARLVMTKS